MKWKSLVFAAAVAVSAPAAQAAEFKCNGDSVEKSGSTHYKLRRSGADITVEKSGSTKGKAVKSGSKYNVEVSGSTKATIENGKIYKTGSTWSTVNDAQKVFDCDDTAAATLWVLREIGAL
ncbi:MAG: hypothetical protein Q8O67_11335 [Deltaproteobacteria bacterium]|nr:hypothetical protein [Deltaproteobacteria bacterium]